MIFTHTTCKPSDERSTQGRVIQKPRSYRFQTVTSRKHGLVAKTVSNWRLPKSIFHETNFFRIAGTSRRSWSFDQWKRWVILVTRATLLASGEAVIKAVPFYKNKKQKQKWRTTFRAQYMSYKNCKPRQHELHCPDGYSLILDWATLPCTLLIALVNMLFLAGGQKHGLPRQGYGGLCFPAAQIIFSPI